MQVPPPQQQGPPQPFMNAFDYQERQDADHLNTLSILYLIYAIFSTVSTVIVLLYFLVIGGIVGLAVTSSATSGQGSMGSAGFAGIGAFILVVGFFVVAISVASCWLLFFTSKSLKERRNWTWIVVSACICLISMPLGTALGIFSLVVMNRPSVKYLFGQI